MMLATSVPCAMQTVRGRREQVPLLRDRPVHLRVSRVHSRVDDRDRDARTRAVWPYSLGVEHLLRPRHLRHDRLRLARSGADTALTAALAGRDRMAEARRRPRKGGRRVQPAAVTRRDRTGRRILAWIHVVGDTAATVPPRIHRPGSRERTCRQYRGATPVDGGTDGPCPRAGAVWGGRHSGQFRPEGTRRRVARRA